jgi:hypothetical protein
MGNWLNYNWIFFLVSPLILALTSHEIKVQQRWGFYGHKRINRIALFTLPPEMFGFYKEHLEYLTEHAVDPDKRRYAVEGEAQCHYIDLDHYYKKGEDPFQMIPKRWEEAIKKYTEDTLQAYGVVPWHINLMKYKLQKAFETRNVDLILKYSADIGHYIGDAHVPLHTTENYNGQLTGQIGIHGLWESRLVELNAEFYNYFVGKSEYIKNTLDLAWGAVRDSHLAVDSVLSIERELTKIFPSDQKYSFEKRGNLTSLVYSYEFSQEYHKRMNGMVERRMRAAILAVGSIWYTAWVDAGQPDLRSLQNSPPSAELIQEMKTLDQEFNNHKHKGRICE